MLKSAENTSLVWTWAGKSYTLPVTTDDMVMLARAIEHEGAPKAGVAWALIQRWAWLHMAGVTSTLAKFVQAYAQPINPRWMYPDGDLYKNEVQNLTDPAEVNAAVARAKARIQKAQVGWDKISNDTKQVLAAVLNNNRTKAVTGAVHYWASRGPDFATNQAKKPNLILLDAGIGYGAGRNVFFADAKSKGFGPTLRFRYGSGVWPTSLGWLPVVVFASGASYFLFRALNGRSKVWSLSHG